MNPQRRRKWGYGLRFIRELINGDDTGYTLVKAGLVITSVLVTSVVVAAFAPYIFAGGVLFAGVYLAVAMRDEYDRNKAEDAKINQIKNLDADVKILSKKFSDSVDEQTLAEEFPDGLVDDYLSNDLLLKYTLRAYLKRLNIQNRADIDNQNAKRKVNGQLPNQNAMIDLIEQVTGFNRLDPEFGAKVRIFLNHQEDDQITEFDEEFGANVVKVLDLKDSGNNDIDITKKEEHKNKFIRYASKIVKHGLNFFWKANTALGLLLGGLIVVGTGIVVVGAPIAVPILILGGVLALISGVAAIAYNRYTEKSYRKNGEAIDESLAEKKTKIALLNRLVKLNSKEYADRNVYQGQTISNKPAVTQEKSVNGMEQTNEKQRLIDRQNQPDTQQPKLTFKSLSAANKARMISHVIVQSLFGFGLGMLVGIAISSIALLLLATVLPPVGIPLMVITAAGLGVGLTYGIRCSYMFGKATAKGLKSEFEQMQKVETLKKKYQDHIVGKENKQTFDLHFSKSKIELLMDVIHRHLDYLERLNYAIAQAQTADEQNKLRQRKDSANEKVLSLIEQTTDLKRYRDVYRHVNKAGDDLFYNKLAELLQGNDKKNSAKYESLVQQLKDGVHGNATAPVQIIKLSTWQKIKNAFASGQVNTFIKNNITGGVFTVLAIGLPLGFLLFSPAALPLVAATVGVIAAVYIGHRIFNWRSEKNKAKLAETEQKLPLIERIVKLDENIHAKKPAPAKTVSLEEDQELVPLNEHEQANSVQASNKPKASSMDDIDEGVLKFNKGKVRKDSVVVPAVVTKDNTRRSLQDIASMPEFEIVDKKRLSQTPNSIFKIQRVNSGNFLPSSQAFKTEKSNESVNVTKWPNYKGTFLRNNNVIPIQTQQAQPEKRVEAENSNADIYGLD